MGTGQGGAQIKSGQKHEFRLPLLGAVIGALQFFQQAALFLRQLSPQAAADAVPDFAQGGMLSDGTIQKLRRGDTTLENLSTICDILRCQPGELLEWRPAE